MQVAQLMHAHREQIMLTGHKPTARLPGLLLPSQPYCISAIGWCKMAEMPLTDVKLHRLADTRTTVMQSRASVIISSANQQWKLNERYRKEE